MLADLETPPAADLSRRLFLKAGAALGGGLMLTFTARLAAAQGALATAELNAFVKIGSDGYVTITPLRIDWTDERMLDELRTWPLE